MRAVARKCRLIRTIERVIMKSDACAFVPIKGIRICICILGMLNILVMFRAIELCRTLNRALRWKMCIYWTFAHINDFDLYLQQVVQFTVAYQVRQHILHRLFFILNWMQGTFNRNYRFTVYYWVCMEHERKL